MKVMNAMFGDEKEQTPMSDPLSITTSFLSHGFPLPPPPPVSFLCTLASLHQHRLLAPYVSHFHPSSFLNLRSFLIFDIVSSFPPSFSIYTVIFKTLTWFRFRVSGLFDCRACSNLCKIQNIFFVPFFFWYFILIFPVNTVIIKTLTWFDISGFA